jgi:hypothetical protein
MPPVALPGHSTTVRRRLALMGAALASAIALLSAITTVDASAATQPTWIVKFENNYSKRIFVATGKVNNAMCGNYGHLETKGWLSLQPGQTKTGIVTSTPYAFFYAKADDGRVWEGEKYNHERGVVTNDIFDLCRWRYPPEAYEVPMRPIKLRDPDPQTLRATKTIHLMY